MKEYIEPVKNTHYWAWTKNNELPLLLIVLCDSYIGGGTFFACGAWECPIDIEDLNLIEEINKPKDCEFMKLYYGDEEV